tara:strand:- start:4430 stop:5020 length:591 start_codon:yes stop_codon:yes gene_type:complete
MKKNPEYKKPAAKKPAAKKPAKVTFKEVVDTPDWETKEKERKELREQYKDNHVVGKIRKSEDKKEFGTPSSLNARHGKKYPSDDWSLMANGKPSINASYEKSQWVANPDLDRSTNKYSQMSKRELEIIGREYGVEVDRRLRRSTIIRIIELAEEAHEKEQAMLEDPFQKKLLQGICVGIAIGFLMGVLFGYGLGVR